MRQLFVGTCVAAVIALCSAPVMAGSLRHGSGSGGGGDESGGKVVKVKPSPDKKKDSDSEVPMAAVPEPGAGLVFAAGALVMASRLRRKKS